MVKQRHSKLFSTYKKHKLILLLAVSLVLLTFGYLYKKNYMLKGAENKSQTTPTYQNSLTLEKILPAELPSGWEKTSDTQFRKTLDGVSYRVGFQLNSEEYLKKDGSYARDLTLLNVVKTKKGTDVYIIKESNGYVYASACEPKSDEACSIPFNNQLLFIMLNTYVPNAQYPVELNFANPGINTILVDFAQIIESSNF